MVWRFLLIAASWTIFVGTIVWPGASLIVASVRDGLPPTGGFRFTGSQLALLGRSLALAAAAAGCSMAAAIPGAVLLAKAKTRAAVLVTMAAALLCPPMVYAFGWAGLFPQGIGPQVRCVLVWVFWTWPVAAVWLGAAWTRFGKSPYEAALLDAPPLSAWLRVVAPALARFAGAVYLVIVVLLVSDYGVPHGFGVRVYATELLAWASESDRAVDGLWHALPVLGVLFVALGSMWAFIGRTPVWIAEPEAGRGSGAPFWAAVCAGLLACGWVAPFYGFRDHISAENMARALQVYGVDIAATLVVSGVAAVLAVLGGAGLAAAHRFQRLAFGLALLFGALPGAVIGQAFIAAYNAEPFAWLYDHWPVVSLAYASRYLWIGILACHVIGVRAGSLAEQARVDGATESQIVIRVLFPSCWPILLGAAAVILALAIGDVPTATLVRVPGFNPVAHVIIEKFHRLEDDMLVSLSLVLVAVAALGAAVVSRAAGRRTIECQLDVAASTTT